MDKKEYLAWILKKQFHEIENEPWNDECLCLIIEIAHDNGLQELVEEFISDLEYEYQRKEIKRRLSIKK